MNKFFALILSLTLLNCSGKDQNNNVVSKQIVTKQNGYEKLTNKSSVKSNETLSIAQFSDVQLPLNFVFFKESEKTFLNINELYLNINWLYTLENDNVNTKNVILFKNKLEYVILVPTFSEEFPTYQMVGIDKSNKFIYHGQHTYNQEDFEKLKGTSFDKIDYQIKKTNNELRIYAIANQKEILLSDYSKMTNTETPITLNEKNEIKKLQKQTTNENRIKTVQNVFLDLNSDGHKENFEVNFNDETIKGNKNLEKEIFLDKKSLIIQKEFVDNNPHDFTTYKYYFSEFNNSVILDKLEFKRETYVENYDICNLNYTFLPNNKIYFSQVDFFDRTFLQSLIRNISLKEAIEITTKTNKNYNCTSSLSITELNFLLDSTVLDNSSVSNYNNLAFYLEKNKQYRESIFLLKNILEKYPVRIVTWLNYGDSLWEINEKSQAKSAYQKYILLMKSQGKDQSKIPQRVNDRI